MPRRTPRGFSRVLLGEAVVADEPLRSGVTTSDAQSRRGPAQNVLRKP